jgi:hypothetical protein
LRSPGRRLLDPLEATAEQMRLAVLDLLEAPGARAAARTIRDEIASLPALDQALPLLETLARGDDQRSIR